MANSNPDVCGCTLSLNNARSGHHYAQWIDIVRHAREKYVIICLFAQAYQ
jgi:hypothetical protein